MCYQCDQLALEHGDVIEVDAVQDERIHKEFRLQAGMRGILLRNNEYFKAVEEMQCDDPKHLAVVFQNNEVCGIGVLFNRMISWRKIKHTDPRLT